MVVVVVVVGEEGEVDAWLLRWFRELQQTTLIS